MKMLSEYNEAFLNDRVLVFPTLVAEAGNIGIRTAEQMLTSASIADGLLERANPETRMYSAEQSARCVVGLRKARSESCMRNGAAAMLYGDDIVRIPTFSNIRTPEENASLCLAATVLEWAGGAAYFSTSFQDPRDYCHATIKTYSLNRNVRPEEDVVSKRRVTPYTYAVHRRQYVPLMSSQSAGPVMLASDVVMDLNDFEVVVKFWREALKFAVALSTQK